MKGFHKRDVELSVPVLLCDVLEGDARQPKWQAQQEILNRTVFYIVIPFVFLPKISKFYKKINLERKQTNKQINKKPGC